jgi:hypothetical protein
MCLTHLAPITSIAGLLAGSDASAFAKFAIVLGVTTIRHRSHISSLRARDGHRRVAQRPEISAVAPEV